MIHATQRWLSTLFGLFALELGTAGAACPAPECPYAGWETANFVRLSVTQPDGGPAMRFAMTLPDPLEPVNMTIDLDMVHGARRQQGEIMLVDGQAMLTRGLEPANDYEIDLLDGPLLTHQLLLALLARSVPTGPDKLAGKRKIDYREKRQTLEVATPSALGTFPPPWTVTGNLIRKSRESVHFALNFAYQIGNLKTGMQLEGEWRKSRQPPQIDPALPLAGWQLYRLGTIEFEQEGRKMQDYAAKPQNMTAATLGELRKTLGSAAATGL